MKKSPVLAATLVLYILGSTVAFAQHGMPGGTPMTFFVTSEPVGDGANLGGLAGADAHCQALAGAVGVGNRNWHAYLSTQARPDQPAINARDRIGNGNTSWNSSHATIGCSQEDLANSGGVGLFYCFAVD